ncbi:MAG: hypothetical protein M5U34_27050 [Chloroflexi bacterium]|nr:hypothetical protein [Chloroflexota bacterium]
MFYQEMLPTNRVVNSQDFGCHAIKKSTLFVASSGNSVGYGVGVTASVGVCDGDNITAAVLVGLAIVGKGVVVSRTTVADAVATSTVSDTVLT